MDAPVIAAVNGTAAGAGVGLVAMADLALCATSSKFNLAYTNAGLTPDAGTSFLLPRMLGVKRTMELLLLNRTLLPAEALGWGLVNEVVSDEQLLERALEIAEQLAQGASGAYGATKRLIAHSLGALESQMVLESETIAAHAVGAEGAEGISAFLEKRKPRLPRQGLALAAVSRGHDVDLRWHCWRRLASSCCASTSSCARRKSRAPKPGTSRSSGGCARRGYAPFNDYRVDFFLALPDEAACQAARARLEPRVQRRREAAGKRPRARLQPACDQDHAAGRAGHAGDQPPPDRARQRAQGALRRLGGVGSGDSTARSTR